MKKNSYLISVLLALCLLNCSKTDNTKTINKLLKIQDTLSITIPDSLPSPSSNLYGYWNYNDTYLGFANDPKANIITVSLFDFGLKKWSSFDLNTEGNHQVYSPGSFDFNDDNTISYFPIATPKILKIDFSGQVMSSVDYSEKYKHSISVLVKNQRTFRNNGKIGFNSTEYLSIDDPKTFETARKYTVYDYNLKTTTHILKYPKEFVGKTWSGNDTYGEAIPFNKKLVHSFSKSHYLYLYDEQGKLEKKAYAGSKFIKDAKALKSRNTDALQDLIKTEMNGNYVGLIYDKWRAVFYRIATYYDTNQTMKDMSDLQRLNDKKAYVVITLNTDFEIIGEDHFTYSDGVHHGIYFVNKNGLHMAMRDTEENKLNFAVIR